MCRNPILILGDLEVYYRKENLSIFSERKRVTLSIYRTNEMLEILKKLVSIPSPTGNTYEAIHFVETYLNNLHIETKRNHKGGLIATLPGQDVLHHRMLTAHVDTLGAMIKEIKPNGRLKLDLIGGFKYNSIEGEYCIIETSS